jgi:hypothetical protein
LPGILPSPGLNVTPRVITFPTAQSNGLFGQGNLYPAPTAVPISGTTYNFGFGLIDEISLANNAISMYKTANSGGAVNILVLIFMGFLGIALLFGLIKQTGK